jgi:putative ATP-dependent endonuclease of OLD family
MYLSKFHIEGYRSIKELVLNFNKGLNIIIGENNSGKTAIIDAIRLCLSYGNQFRDVYLDKDRDFYIDAEKEDADAKEIHFDLIFEIDDQFEAAVFTDFVSQDPNVKERQTIQLHFRYWIETRNDTGFLRWSIWGGDNEGQAIPSEVLQLISFTYLSPLRDAVEKLRPNSRGNKIAELYKNLKSFNIDANEAIPLNRSKKDSLADTLQQAVKNPEWIGVVKTGQGKVKEHIIGSSVRGKEPKVEFNFLPYKFEGIVNSIDAKTPLQGRNEKFDISQNGLGENNIIYAATVLGDLVNNQEGDLKKRNYFYQALLIEEPEAHLHPQKQNTFFKYLNTFDEKGIQLFITSHSPTITAKAKLDYLIVLQKQKNKISAFTVSNSCLKPENKKYLEKFLDVTKSQLFFSNGTVLVEGISEALLLPAFAKKMSLETDVSDKYDLDKNGIEIVNVGGVAFDPFAKLYNSPEANKRLAAKCSLISDDDRGLVDIKSFSLQGEIDTEKSQLIFKTLKAIGVIDKSNRIQKIELDDLVGFDAEKVVIRGILEGKINEFSGHAKNALALKVEDGNLDVRLAERTFEYELMIADKYNLRLMKSIYAKMHPETKFLGSDRKKEEKATEILEKLKSNKDKSEFAMNLSCALSEKDHLLKRFVVPEYIQKAIQWVIPE